MAWDATGIRDKLDRFDANLREYSVHFKKFGAERHAYTIVPEFNPETEWHTIYIEPPKMPPVFGLIAGEAAHNLRSCLDHIAWQLATLDGIPENPKRVMFPTLSTEPKDFFAHGSVNGMRDIHKEILESLQPYKVAHGQTNLESLAWINNTDKHRVIHAGTAWVENLAPTNIAAYKEFRIVGMDFEPGGFMLEGRTKIGKVRIAPTSVELQMYMQSEPTVQIVFGDPDSPLYGQDIHGALRALKDYVEQMVTLFDRPGQSGLPPWP